MGIVAERKEHQSLLLKEQQRAERGVADRKPSCWNPPLFGTWNGFFRRDRWLGTQHKSLSNLREKYNRAFSIAMLPQVPPVQNREPETGLVTGHPSKHCCPEKAITCEAFQCLCPSDGFSTTWQVTLFSLLNFSSSISYFWPSSIVKTHQGWRSKTLI